uniref:Uncharacterized protein n=1 Tax=Rhizophora mucronata TaxID=61149 RepID=A0A2P2QFS1_RHIMU
MKMYITKLETLLISLHII